MDRRSLIKLMTLSAAAKLSPPAAFAQRANLLPDSGAVPRVLFNQVGYLPQQQKFATILGTTSAVSGFAVHSLNSDRIAFSGTLTAPLADAASGDIVRTADLSGLTIPGHYTIQVANAVSDPFVIAPDIYASPLRTTMRAFYGQRCGCAVDLGDGYHHAACHTLGDYHPSSGKSGRLPNLGGWHDAGDYGRYIVNSGITCGTLLWAWELYPSVLNRLDLGIPRTHAHLPDFLAEVLWNLNWMMQLQDTDGGVFHKQTSDHFCAFIMPERDTLPSEIIGTGSTPFKSTGATADFAAVMSIAARCFAPYDSALSAHFLANARRAWTWAKANPNVVFRNPPGVSTGEYGDPNLTDELLWASAELWRTTGERPYEDAFLSASSPSKDCIRIDTPSWGSVASLACWTYALADRPKRRDIADAIRAATLDSATRLIQQAHQNGYGNTLSLSDYVWGSNSVAANQSLLLAVAHRLQPDTKLAAVALTNLHYLLGRNCHGVSFVTQIGTRPFQHPHHRPSAADNIAAPWPGLLSGGPNSRPGDDVAKQLPTLPPMKMWVDDERAYSMNEVAINWNAPLVFLLAFANTL